MGTDSIIIAVIAISLSVLGVLIWLAQEVGKQKGGGVQARENLKASERARNVFAKARTRLGSILKRKL